MREIIDEYIKEALVVKESLFEDESIEKIVKLLIDVYKNGNKVLLCGNGGSAADCQHFAAELVGRYKMERRGLPAIALTTDTSILTALGNDYGYDDVFRRQVEALGVSGDLFIGISTSGNSANVMKAVDEAELVGMKTVCFLGRDGGEIVDMCDLSFVVKSNNTPRIQEAHIFVIHVICEILEKELFANKNE